METKFMKAQTIRLPKIATDRWLVGAVFAVLLALPAAFPQNLYLLRLGGMVGLYITLALGLNVVAGFAGVLDMGYIAFFGIGAYTYALLNSYQLGLHLPFYVSAPAAAVAGLAASLLVGLPTLRLRGDYLAIVTLAFGQIVRLLFTNLDRPFNLTGGPNGIVGIDPPLGLGPGLASLGARFYLIMALAAVVSFLSFRLARTKYGRAWTAMKGDRQAARCAGIDVNRYRLLALGYGAVVASLAGAVFATWQGAVFPQNFTMQELVTLFCMVVLGGAGSVAGSVLGAVALVGLPELLRGYSIYRMLIYGVTLVLVMRFRPDGILPRRVGRVSAPEIRASDEAPAAASDQGTTRPEPRPEGVGESGYEVPLIEGGRLTVQGLAVEFGGLRVLDNVSFEVRPGEVFGIIGPNGAGKTTLLNVISGVTRPTAGTVSLDDEVLTGLDAHEVAERGIARTFQNIRLFPELSVEENILVGHHRRLEAGFLSTILGLPSWQRAERSARAHVTEVLAFLGHHMDAKRHVPVTSLNYADRRRVELARAVIGNPKILLLDEPAAGMTSEELPALIAQIKELNGAGYTILVIEHHMEIIREACNRVMVLHHGQELALGPFESIARNQAVVNAYLGTKRDRTADAAPPAPAEEDRVRRQLRPSGGRARQGASPLLLTLSGVHAAYGPVKVLQGLDIEVREGEITCLLGANSAGKTTTLNAILGVLPVSAGRIQFDGLRLDGRPTSEIIRSGLAVVPEGRRVFTRLSVRENLELGGYLNRPRLARNLDRVHELFPVLAERCGQKAGTLSGGEQQMLAIARALMCEPRLILLDEPSMGLAPLMVETVMRAVKEINDSGTSILLVEQNATAALTVADRAYLLRLGQATPCADDSGSLAEGLRQAYLA